jgi:hypothetical protein
MVLKNKCRCFCVLPQFIQAHVEDLLDCVTVLHRRGKCDFRTTSWVPGRDHYGHAQALLQAVEGESGSEIDYAMLHKLYGMPQDYETPVKRVVAEAGKHTASVVLNYFSYNFIKIHRTLRMSPAWPLE